MIDSQLTRCPECRTLFRATGAQLALAGGRVRCGRCQHVFNALAHRELEQERPAAPAGEAPAASGVATAAPSEAVPGAADAGSAEAAPRLEGAAPRLEETAAGAGREAIAGPAEGEALVAGPAPSLEDDRASEERSESRPGGDRAELPSDGDRAVERGASSPEEGQAREPRAESLLDDAGATRLPAAEGSIDDALGPLEPAAGAASESPGPETPIDGETTPGAPSERPAPEHTVADRFSWEQPALPARPRSWLWAALVPVLALLLAVQAVYPLRHTLAARVPALEPALLSVCARLGCTIEPPRGQDRLSIEASELQVDAAHKGLLILTATIRNRAEYAVAYPHLELTLTDLQDQAVVRRVLAPAEYAGGTARLDAGVAANGEVAVKLFIDASATQQQGYRLSVFYP
jgi:predicted Zn finger-like uncharacterized protein